MTKRNGWDAVRNATYEKCKCGAYFIPNSWNQKFCTEDCKLLNRIQTKKPNGWDNYEKTR